MQPDANANASDAVVNIYESKEMNRRRVIVYTRVSTRPQAKDGVSVEDQKLQLEEFALAHNLDIVESFFDVGSATNEQTGCKRKGFIYACRLALKNDWEIIVTVPSRFTRTLEPFDRFHEKGGRLIAAKLGLDATHDELRAALKIEIAELEQRQRTAMLGRKRAIAEGKLVGHTVPEFGRVKSIETRQQKALEGYAEFMRQEAAARGEGANTHRELAVTFNKAGFRTPQNCRWKASNVRRVLEAIAQLKAAGELPMAP